MHADLDNGGVVSHDLNLAIGPNLNPNGDSMALLPNGNPIMRFVLGNKYQVVFWNGNSWEHVQDQSNPLFSGTISNDGAGGLWVFQSSNWADTQDNTSQSNGVIGFYSNNGVYGPWTQRDVSWHNGLRFDSAEGSTSNLIRYIDFDAQLSNDTPYISVISLIPDHDIGEGKDVFTINAETTINDGVITTVNGVVGDQLELSGDYQGTGTIVIDVNPQAETADMLFIKGDIKSSRTKIRLNFLNTNKNVPYEIDLIEVTGNTSEGDFVFPGGTTQTTVNGVIFQLVLDLSLIHI